MLATRREREELSRGQWPQTKAILTEAEVQALPDKEESSMHQRSNKIDNDMLRAMIIFP